MESHALARAALKWFFLSSQSLVHWSDAFVQTVPDWARFDKVRGAIDRHNNGLEKLKMKRLLFH